MISRHSLGSVARLYLDIISAGVGLNGETPFLSIQRVSDSMWFQSSDDTWQPTIVSNPASPTDAVNLPGRYHFDFDQSKDPVEGSTQYIVKKTNGGANARLEYEDLAFGPLAGSVGLDLCSVQGTISTAQGEPQQNILVRATLEPVFSDALGRTVEGDRPVVTYTNELGDFDLPLVRGAIFRLEIDAVGYNRRITVPDQASILFTDL